MAEFETVLYEEEKGVAWVTLNRPESYNAFNKQMREELYTIWQAVRTNDDVRCVVVTGAGDRAFCTGIDRQEAIEEDYLQREQSPYATPWNSVDMAGKVAPKTSGLWKPAIAAVNGIACAGAFYILGEMEFIIAADHATFFDPHVTYGMTAAFEPTFMLQKMPFSEIMRMSLLGAHERMTAERAYQIGLVSQVVPKEDLKDAAAWAAGVIADQHPIPIGGTVRALWAARELSRRQALDLCYLYTSLGTRKEILREGQDKFASGARVDWRPR
jgi:enoyl-CoA hydratase/carnithine racemase